jgi:hypothetical protein
VVLYFFSSKQGYEDTCTEAKLGQGYDSAIFGCYLPTVVSVRGLIKGETALLDLSTTMQRSHRIHHQQEDTLLDQS